MSRYELSLCTEYVRDWSIRDALRELFQNALDQQTVKEDNPMFFSYDEETETFEIGNKSSVLDAATLLLGYTTKAKDKTLIGKFGEGYKLAFLVLLRMGKEVKLFNYGKREVWEPYLVKSKKYGGQTVLVVETDKHFIWESIPHHDLIFRVRGITKKEYEDALESNLHMQEDIGEVIDCPKGRILLDERFKGQVYVNGLYVCPCQQYLFGYDVKPEHIKIDRDRRLVSDFDLRWLASSLWLSSGSPRIIELAKQGAPDVFYIAEQSHIQCELHDEAFAQFIAEFGEDAVPVVSQDEMERFLSMYKKVRPVIVSPGYGHLITRGSGYSYHLSTFEKRSRDPEGKLWDWFERNKRYLSESAISEFQEIFQELRD